MAKKWALVLGASSGFGGACAVKLAEDGFNIIGIHLDRKVTMPNVDKIIKKIKKTGQQAIFFNINAADQIKRNDVLDELQEMNDASKEENKINVLIHSLAFGSLKPFIGKNQSEITTPAQLNMTLDVMANSLVYWTQGLVLRDMLAEGARIFALTSAGSTNVIPSYGAVSAAKAALESHIRQLAVELGSMKVTANAIMAGVTDTPALRKIPGNVEMLEAATMKNPGGRLTTPEDVAQAISLLCDDRAYWISGNTIGVDGAEYVTDYTGKKVCNPIK